MEIKTNLYGDIDDIKILTCSSGKFKIEVRTKMMSFEDANAFIDKIMELIRAPRSVEA